MRTMVAGVVFLFAGSLTSVALAGGECCDKAMASNAWCGHCKVGFVACIPVKSESVHKAMAGAPASADTKCEDCKKAIAANGTCHHCHISFVSKTAYKSPVAARLVAGTCVEKAKMACDTCKKNSADHGWCDKCKAGFVGCSKFTDKAAYETAVKAKDVLDNANKTAAKCEPCAIAMVTDGTCDKCKVSYKDGKQITSTGGAPKPAQP